jgi:beta-galactosidase
LRQRLLLDSDWRFNLGHACDPVKDFGFGKLAQDGTFAKSGEPGGPAAVNQRTPFDDSSWKVVNLPHDWAVDLPFVLDKTLVWHGGKPLGREFPDTSVGWYRRKFTIPSEDLGKRIFLQFDGVYRDAMVFCNGHLLGENSSGYAPFEFDISDFVNYGGENLLALRVDASLNEGWFYEGAGIYRHVWITKTASVRIAQWGNFVQSKFKSGLKGAATLALSTEVVNDTEQPAECVIFATVVDANGVQITSAQSKRTLIAPSSSATLEMEAVVQQPNLWSLETPHLYRLMTVLSVDGKNVDHDETTFGIRTIRFDADKGFFLNDQPVKIKGTCNHQDHAGLGAALPDRMQAYRIALLREMGANAYRTSHNCPTSELLDACDEQGMLVLDETRNFSSSTDGLKELERMVKRDRNHPSVIMWSIANEERQQGTERGARIGRTMKRLVKSLDPTRPVTAAMNGEWGKGLSGVVDVQGFNYRVPLIDAYRKQFPRQPLIGTETASTLSTRGVYFDDAAHGYVGAYDTSKPQWGNTAEEWWKFYDEREWLAGGFVWTGFDYRGEPTPYHLPCVGSHFGLMDTCGFPKDNYFYYRTWWRTEPSLHLFPHWNWLGKEGTEIEVWCYCNQDSVELLLNGKSLGTQKAEKNGHLVWRVAYIPGVLEARATRNGAVVSTAKRETAGPAERIRLKPHLMSIKADGEDVSVVQVEVLDAQDQVVPLADDLIHFNLTGSGTILGVGNGDPSCYEPDHAAQRSAFKGLCMCIVQSSKQSGVLTLTVSSSSLKEASVVIECAATTPRPSLS